jgi:predicted nuclease of predicted toxin-antitoxin system
MYFLVDAQLPEILCETFRERGHECSHVEELLGDGASDIEIFRRSLELGAVIVTKDSDFSRMQGNRPLGRVVWLRFGNISNVILLSKIRAILPELERELEGGAKFVEVR